MRAGKYQDHVLKRDGRISLPSYFSKLNSMDKQACVGWWYENEGHKETPSFVKEWVKAEYKNQKRRKEEHPKRYQGKQFLFTCNGDWGVGSGPERRELIARRVRGDRAAQEP